MALSLFPELTGLAQTPVSWRTPLAETSHSTPKGPGSNQANNSGQAVLKRFCRPVVGWSA